MESENVKLKSNESQKPNESNPKVDLELKYT